MFSRNTLFMMVASGCLWIPACKTAPTNYADKVGAELLSRRNETPCQGRVRFPKQDGTFDQEVGVVSLRGTDAKSAAEEAERIARKKLRERVCGDDRELCIKVESAIHLYKHFRTDREACAYVLLDRADLSRLKGAKEEEIEASRDRQLEFAAALDKTADRMAAFARSIRADPEAKPVVLVRSAAVDCVVGGRTPDWLRGRIESALIERGVSMKASSAYDMLEPNTAMLEVKAGSMKSVPGTDLPGYEVMYELHTSEGVQKYGPLYVTNDLTPTLAGNASAHKPQCTALESSRSELLSMEWTDTVQAGGLCEYQPSHLMVHAAIEGEARAIFISEDRQTGFVYFPTTPDDRPVITSSKHQDVTGETIIVKLSPQQDVETHVLLHAKQATDFGPLLARVDRICSLKPAQIDALLKGHLVPQDTGVQTLVKTYQVLDIDEDAVCRQFDTRARRAQAKQGLELLRTIPSCDDLM